VPRRTLPRFNLLVTLPPGLTTRPLVHADIPAVTAIMAAAELAATGEVSIEEADLVAEWSRPSFDLARQTEAVLDGDLLVGYVEHSGGDRGDACVHGDYLGRGIGTYLAHRMQEIARAAGSTVVGMPVPAGSAGDRLLEVLGYRVRWNSWVLTLPEGREIPARPLPEGYAVREAREDEHQAVFTVVEDAFLEWSTRERQSFEDFVATVMGRPGFEPWHLRVVADPGGQVVGAALVLLAEPDGTREGYVERLAVRKDQRGRGLAQALLVDAFARAREHGAVRSALSTDSRTGALGLYEKVGMEVTQNWVNRAIDL
jgi:ribosomal protein S18 acetylase RimI-like enzyme